MSLNLSRVDISGQWRPGTVGLSLYGEAKREIQESYHKRYYMGLVFNPAHYAKHATKIMGFVDIACAVTDTAIWRMMSINIDPK